MKNKKGLTLEWLLKYGSEEIAERVTKQAEIIMNHKKYIENNSDDVIEMTIKHEQTNKK